MNDGMNGSGRERGSGRFLPGNRFGTRRTGAKCAEKFRRIVRKKLTKEDFDVIAGALIKQARKGNISAIRLVLAYALDSTNPTLSSNTRWSKSKAARRLDAFERAQRERAEATGG